MEVRTITVDRSEEHQIVSTPLSSPSEIFQYPTSSPILYKPRPESSEKTPSVDFTPSYLLALLEIPEHQLPPNDEDTDFMQLLESPVSLEMGVGSLKSSVAHSVSFVGKEEYGIAIKPRGPPERAYIPPAESEDAIPVPNIFPTEKEVKPKGKPTVKKPPFPTAKVAGDGGVAAVKLAEEAVNVATAVSVQESKEEIDERMKKSNSVLAEEEEAESELSEAEGSYYTEDEDKEEEELPPVIFPTEFRRKLSVDENHQRIKNKKLLI